MGKDIEDKRQNPALLRLSLILIPVIGIFVNVSSLFFIDPLASVMIEDEVLHTIDSITGIPIVRFLNQVLPVAVFSLLFVFYCIPLYKAFWNGRIWNDSRPVPIQRMMNAATFFALFTGIGWIVSIPIVIVAGWILKIHMSHDFYFQYISHSSVLFGFDFILVYYSVEALIRRVILPRIFTGNEALENKSRFSLSIRLRLLILMSAAFLLPSLIFFNAIRNLNNAGLNILGRDLMPVIEIALPVLCFILLLITWFKVLSIELPIRDLIEAAKQIEKGNFDIKVTVRSTDRIGHLGGAFNDMTAGLAERERMRGLFGKIVDPRVRDYLLKNDFETQGTSQEATVIFFDLAGFTSLSENRQAEDIVKILNLYFEAVTGCVENHGGLVNKFIGDGVLAVFGVPNHFPDHAEKAVSAVESLNRVISRLNKKVTEKGIPALRFRAGIHTGEILSGMIGSKSRQEYTVIGDAVNIASRIEQLGKTYNESVIITRDTVSQLEKMRPFKPLGAVQIRGRLNDVELYCLPL